MAEADNKDNNTPNEEKQPIDQQETAQPKPKIEPPPRQPVPITITDIELEKLKREASEYKDKYQRALAESENARKRLQKERQELVQYALQNAMCDFLNPIDHLENALKFTQQASDEVKHWALGFQMILNQFKDALSANGVTSYESAGAVFDPHSHEAVEMVTTTEYLPGTVVNESLRGYKMGDRIIRPARVTVAKAPPQEASGKEEEKKVEQNNK